MTAFNKSALLYESALTLDKLGGSSPLQPRVGDLSNGIELDWSHNVETTHNVGNPPVKTTFVSLFLPAIDANFVTDAILGHAARDLRRL